MTDDKDHESRTRFTVYAVHSLPEQRKWNPVRWIVKASGVQYQNEVLSRMVSTNRRKVAGSLLGQCPGMWKGQIFLPFFTYMHKILNYLSYSNNDFTCLAMSSFNLLIIVNPFLLLCGMCACW